MPEQHLSGGALLGWTARALAIASKSGAPAAENWLIGAGAPERALRVVRSAVPGGSVDLGTTGEVAIGQWTDTARTTSAFYRIFGDGAFTRLPVNTLVSITTTPATATVVGEGAAKPVSPIRLQNVRLSSTKASSLVVVSDQLLRDTSAAGQMALNRALIAAVSDAVDAAFLAMVVNTGTTQITSAGATAINAKKDLKDALMAVNTAGSAKLYWLCGVDVAKRASTLADTAGSDAFPAMSASGGELANLPAIVSSGILANELVLVDASGIAADAGPVSVDVSSRADILMDTVPSMSSGVPTAATMTSMFQTNSTAMRCEAWFAAEALRANAVAVITGISWGGA